MTTFLVIIISYQSKDAAIWPSNALRFTCSSSQPTASGSFANGDVTVCWDLSYHQQWGPSFFIQVGVKNYGK